MYPIPRPSVLEDEDDLLELQRALLEKRGKVVVKEGERSNALKTEEEDEIVDVPDFEVIGEIAERSVLSIQEERADRGIQRRSQRGTCSLFRKQRLAKEEAVGEGETSSHVPSVEPKVMKHLDAKALEEAKRDNDNLLKSLDPKEIEKMKQELLKSDRIKPDLLKFLQKRGAVKKKEVPPERPLGEPESLPAVTKYLEELRVHPRIASEHKWLHMTKVEAEKLEWMVKLPTQAAERLNEARFEKSGRLSCALEETHSVEDLLNLLRSAVPSQNVYALDVLAKMLRLEKAMVFRNCLDVLLLDALIRSGLVFLLRHLLDENQNLQLLVAVINLLHAIFVNVKDEQVLDDFLEGQEASPILGSLLDTCDKQDTEFEEVTDYDFLQVDTVRGILRTGILPRFRYILSVLKPNVECTHQILDILIRFCRHSEECSVAVLAFEESFFLRYFDRTEAEWRWQGRKLLRLLLTYSPPDVRQKLASQYIRTAEKTILPCLLSLKLQGDRNFPVRDMRKGIEEFRILSLFVQMSESSRDMELLGDMWLEAYSGCLEQWFRFAADHLSLAEGEDQKLTFVFLTTTFQSLRLLLSNVSSQRSLEPAVYPLLISILKWSHELSSLAASDPLPMAVAFGALGQLIKMVPVIQPCTPRLKEMLDSFRDVAFPTLISSPGFRRLLVRGLPGSLFLLKSASKTEDEEVSECLPELRLAADPESELGPVSTHSLIFLVRDVLQVADLWLQQEADIEVRNIAQALRDLLTTSAVLQIAVDALPCDEQTVNNFVIAPEVEVVSSICSIAETLELAEKRFRLAAFRILPYLNPSEPSTRRALCRVFGPWFRSNFKEDVRKQSFFLQAMERVEDLKKMYVSFMCNSPSAEEKSRITQRLVRSRQIPVDWLYLPIRQSVEPKNEEAERTIAELNLLAVHLVHAVCGEETRLMPMWMEFRGLSSVFLMETAPFFETKKISPLMNTLSEKLVLRSPNADEVLDPPRREKPPALKELVSHYQTLLETFAATSYGHKLFAAFLLQPARTCNHPEYRRLFWDSDETLSLIRNSIDELFVLDVEPWVIHLATGSLTREVDGIISRMMKRVLASGIVSRSRNPAVYAICHKTLTGIASSGG